MYNYMGRCRYPVLDPTNHHVNTILVLRKSGQDDGRVSPLGGDAPFACDPGIQLQQLQAHCPLHDEPREPHVLLPSADAAADAELLQTVVPEPRRHLPFQVIMELPLVIGLELVACVVVVDLQDDIDKARCPWRLSV